MSIKIHFQTKTGTNEITVEKTTVTLGNKKHSIRNFKNQYKG